MSELVRCSACQGKKRMMGMGGMYKACNECNAVGWIETDDEQPLKVDSLKTPKGQPVKATVKKKTRPKAKVQPKEANLGV